LKVFRHSLSGQEKTALIDIAARASDLVPDRPILASAILRAQELPDAERQFNIDFDPVAFHSLEKALTAALEDEDSSPLFLLDDLPLGINPVAVTLAVGSMLGGVREYLGHGAPVVEVADHAEIMNARPSSDNNLEFQLHTDMTFYPHPPTHVLFYMLEPAADGGASVFCDAQSILERLPGWAIDELRKPVRFPAPPHLPSGEPQYHPILIQENERRTSIRFRRDGLEALSETQAQALELWTRELDANQFELQLRAGELSVFSNVYMLHGRRAFRNACNGSQRRALRAYCNFHESKR
jgi:hypothetical protein